MTIGPAGARPTSRGLAAVLLAVTGGVLLAIAMLAGSGSTADASQGCRDSRDPRCSDFKWAPKPTTNAPATAQLLSIDQVPLGDDLWEVTFAFQVIDPDARIICRSDEFGDGLAIVCDPWWAVLQCEPAHGPWKPPAPDGETLLDSISWIYDGSGDYDVRFSWSTAAFGSPEDAPGDADGVCFDPYASEVSWTGTITVGSG